MQRKPAKEQRLKDLKIPELDRYKKEQTKKATQQRNRYGPARVISSTIMKKFRPGLYEHSHFKAATSFYLNVPTSS